MNRYIICPEIYRTRWTDFYLYLFHLLRVEFHFEVLFIDKPPNIKDPELLFLFAIPQHDRQGFLFDWIMNLPKSTKIISYMRDLHSFNNPVYEFEIDELFTRYDVILSAAIEQFENWYPEHVYKMVFFPDFFGPYERYARLPILSEPLNRCLLSGAYNPEVYEIRHHIISNGDRDRIIHIPPPYGGTEHTYIGDRYALLLNRFQCCVTDTGKYKAALNKCFEIPAAGSLLLCNQVSDMDKCGFKPDVHYVPITKENCLETIYKVLDNPSEYEKIKREGREFVLKSHSLENRFQFLKMILKSFL
jgi:hypothetical protein